jgi:hypothetical protein
MKNLNNLNNFLLLIVLFVGIANGRPGSGMKAGERNRISLSGTPAE